MIALYPTLRLLRANIIVLIVQTRFRNYLIRSLKELAYFDIKITKIIDRRIWRYTVLRGRKKRRV